MISYRKGVFSWRLGTKMYCFWIWCMRVSPNLGFFYSCWPFPIFLLALFLFFLSTLLFSFILLFISFLSAIKKLVLQLWIKPGNGTIIDFRCNGPFYHQFCTKNWQGFISITSARMWLMSKTDSHADRSILALLTAYQECLVMCKLNVKVDFGIKRVKYVSDYPVSSVAFCQAIELTKYHGNSENYWYDQFNYNITFEALKVRHESISL